MFGWVVGLLNYNNSGHGHETAAIGGIGEDEDWELVDVEEETWQQAPRKSIGEEDLAHENGLIEKPFYDKNDGKQLTSEEDSSSDGLEEVVQRRSPTHQESVGVEIAATTRRSTAVNNKLEKKCYQSTAMATTATANYNNTKSERARKPDKRRSSKQGYNRNSRVNNDRRCGNKCW